MREAPRVFKADMRDPQPQQHLWMPLPTCVCSSKSSDQQLLCKSRPLVLTGLCISIWGKSPLSLSASNQVSDRLSMVITSQMIQVWTFFEQKGFILRHYSGTKGKSGGRHEHPGFLGHLLPYPVLIHTRRLLPIENDKIRSCQMQLWYVQNTVWINRTQQ